ncbi:transcription initiation factor TFIID subunit 7 [Purpureocillium lavendulum]|uniref:Transcription initiation factor TFIID subunit 7 n=1 Tax=Purpureocillium lavendulum TaxID=1247861 RepID=A0AB34G5S3_9HYPO|nr:transcription initiation factor TFIID subunit 7 [Purpureocillium lavendulum]
MSAPGDGSAMPAPPPKPRLKINVSRSSSFVGPDAAAAATPGAATAGAAQQTPVAVTPGDGAGPRKVKLKINSSQPPTPSLDKDKAPPPPPPPVIKTKAGRQPKPTQKLVESKKRTHDDDEDLPLAVTAGGPPTTKIKIRQSIGASKAGPTQLVLKPRGRPPHHPPGDGYDSEASDREVDPAIEEQFVLRMPPGEHCEYVRSCMETGKMGIPRSQGGADVVLKFFDEDSRRAMVTVKGQSFAAVMVDLPTITEAMKTWDKKSFMKSADICQMLLVFQMVKDEAEAKTAPLPSTIDTNFKWPHGLTPPMHDCVNRRFAKTISRKEIEDKEAEVERLLAEDAKAASTKWEWVDERQREGEEEYGADEDAEGEVDDSAMGYFGAQDGSVVADGGLDDNDLEADLEAAFADEFMAETPATGMDMTTPMTTQVETPAAGLHESIENDESEEDDDDDDDDEDDDDLDEDQRAQRDEEQGVRDIINDMTKQLARRKEDLSKTANKILRSRLENQIKQLKSEIELKKSSIGMETDD